MSFLLSALIAASAVPALVHRPALDQPTGPAASTEETRPPLTSRDSTRALKSARRAQNSFEVLRRRLLPRQAGLTGRTCDVVIGRYCHWQEPGGFGPPPESPKVIAAREEFLDVLDSLGRLVPEDRWILAQKLRYRVEAGRPDEAERVATECASRATQSATRRWCRALTGYMAQERGDYAHADSAFTAALTEMPEPERCAWQDLSLVLDGKARGRYKGLDCAARDSMASSLWRLVQPLYLTGVNDLRTEFLARVTRMHMEKDSRTPLSPSQRRDDQETLLRFGAGLWFAQDDASGSGSAEAAVASFRRGPSFNFFPQPRALASPEQLRPEDWEFAGAAPPTRHAPGYAQHFGGLNDHQLALFRRGDSALIVAAFDVTDDPAFSGSQLQAGVFAAPLDNGGVAPPVGIAIGDAGRTTVTTIRAPWRPMIVSLEVLDRVQRSAGRVRYSVRLPSPGARLSLSDLLLYAPQDSTPPADLMDAVPVALHSSRVSSHRPLGLFWETYGVHSRRDELDIAVVVEPIGQRWIGRAFTKLGLRDRPTTVTVQWRERPEATPAGITARGLAVDLSQLKPGRYRVRLSVKAGGDQPVVVERDIEVLL